MNSSILLIALFSIAAPPVETSATPTTRLYVRTIPSGAEVRLDGKPAGKSDDLFVVPAGVRKMTIEVELDGHYPEHQDVQIRGGRITRVELKMLRRTAAEGEKPAVATKPDSPSAAAGFSHALHFDGRAGSYVEIPNLDMGRLTFATWVKRDVTAKKQPLILSARYGGWGVYFSEIPGADNPGGTNDYVWFTHRGAGGWHSDVEIADRQWHFVAVTLDGNSLKFYVDGKPAGNTSMGYTIDSGGSGYCLGGATESPGEPCRSLQGCLEETLVFNKPLNPAEIARLYIRGRHAHGVGSMDGLIAGYHFDEGAGTTAADFSGHGNTGTLKGGVTWVPGRAAVTKTRIAGVSHALHFDGTRYVTLPQSLKFTSGDFTVSLWFDPTTAKESQFLFIRGFAWGDKQGDIGLKINPNSGDLDFEARTADSQWHFGWDAPESSLRSPFRLNQWNHVVVTRCGDRYTLWMNGVKVASEDSTANISDTNDTNPFLVGGMMADNGVQDMFQGDLDGFCIFHRSLSDTEIAVLYNHGNGLYVDAGARGLVAGYHFDEGAGSVIHDFSRNGNDGVFHTDEGNAAWVPGPSTLESPSRRP